MTKLTFIDLFCGIGGFHQALIKINKDNKCILASDICPKAKAVYQDNYGDDIPFNDNIKYITQLEFKKKDTELQQIQELSPDEYKKALTKNINTHIKGKLDVICGGFPCQPFSNGGQKGAFLDPRGTLFYDIIEIANVKKPKFMFLENVKHIKKVSNGDVYKAILNTLKETGYKVFVNIISPHQLGVPQQRERVIFSCIRNDVYHKALVKNNGLKNIQLEGEFPLDIQPDIKIDFTKIIDKVTSEELEKYKISEELENVLNCWNKAVEFVDDKEKLSPTILAENLKTNYFQLDDEGNIAFNTDKEPIVKNEYLTEWNSFPTWKKDYILKNKTIYNTYKSKWDKWLKDNDKLLKKKKIYSKLEWQTGPKKKNDTIWNYFIQIRQSGIRVKKAKYFPTLVAIVQTPIYGKEKRYITPRECARLQSFPDSFKLPEKDQVAYKQFGNAVNVDVVYTVMKKVLDTFN